MKLSYKIMAGVMLVVAVLLAVHSYLVVNREIAQFREDMNLHAYLLGTVLATSVSDVWKSGGPSRAMGIIADANRSEQLVRVRLVWLDQKPLSKEGPLVNIQQLQVLREGKELLVPDYSVGGVKYHIAYFPVKLDPVRPCALELSQPLAPMLRHTKITILQKIEFFLAFLLVGGVLVWWLGIRLVGRPVRSLVEQARDVGHGNLNAINDLEKSRDEIGSLARGLNKMVLDLRVARDRLDKETVERLNAVEQLNHAERLSTVGKLASGLAHELGTPLNVVSGHAKMISDGGMDAEEITKSAAVIKQQADRMASLIRKLLDFARRSPVEMKKEKLSHPIEQVTHLLTPLASGRSATIAVKGETATPTVRIDSAHMQQVISNLIVNAIHAMPNGGEVTVNYGVRRAQPPADRGGAIDDFAYIDIADKGVGIPEENLTRIFTPFFSTKQVGEGTGLGLSIVFGIINEHGGWITVNSVVGEGSVFSIYLPLEGDIK